jgi:hypothetical protein
MPVITFTTPEWIAADSHYQIKLEESFIQSTIVELTKDKGAIVFGDVDKQYEITVEILHRLIREGTEQKWFSKLPTHEQLLKRVRHTFSSLPHDDQTIAVLKVLYLTPKSITFLWTPESPTKYETKGGLYFEDSDCESDEDEDLEIPESDLPPVSLREDPVLTQEEYLLTRLRAAKARVESEQIKMKYFEMTGKMPPDSDSEEDEDSE